MIDKVEFTARNLTSNTGVLVLLNYTEEQRIFQVKYSLSYFVLFLARELLIKLQKFIIN